MSQIRIQILGPLRLWRDGLEVDIGPPQQTQLLAMLVARANHAVQIDQLIEDLWGDKLPRSARNILHKYVGSLRRTLEPDLPLRREGAYLSRRGEGYSFLADQATLDLLEFRAHVAAARRATDDQRASAGYISALDLWEGVTASGLDRVAGSGSIYSTIDAEVLDVVVAATLPALRVGAPQSVVPHLRRAIEIAPLDELAIAALVNALSATGHRAEALSVFRDARNRLSEQLGIDPGMALSEAHRRVLEHGRESAPPSTQPRTDRAVSAEPQRITDFVGREAEFARLQAFLAVNAVNAEALVISGPPGIGKTSTALEIIRHEGSRRLFVNLHGVDPEPLTPLEVLRTLLSQVNEQEDPPGTLDEASVAWRAATQVAGAVVILDDAGSEAQVRPVLSTDLALRVIVTSRLALPGIDARERIVLGPLPRAESVAFLANLIPAARTNDGDLAELAALCGDFPLALRIAGSRVGTRPNWAIEDFLTRLRDERGRIKQLAAGDLAVASAFALSYDALGSESSALFCNLSLLHGTTFSAQMAAAIDDRDPSSCRDTLDALADLGLVEVAAGDRYRLHDLIRVFAADRLRDTSTEAEVAARRNRLDRWTLIRTAEAATKFPDSWAPVPIATAATEAELRDAREWLTRESAHWFQAFESAAADGDSEIVLDTAMAVKSIATEWWTWGPWARVHELGIWAARELDDDRGLVVQTIAHASAMSSDIKDASAEGHPARQALLAAETLGDPYWVAQAHYFLAESYMSEGEVTSCIREAKQAEREFGRLGYVGPQIGTRALIAKAIAEHDINEALSISVETIAMIDGLGPNPERQVQTVELHNAFTVAARLLLRLERFDQALEITRRMLLLPDQYLEQVYAAYSLRYHGLALVGLARDDEAREAFESALSLAGSYLVEAWANNIQDALDAIDARNLEKK